MTRRRDVVDAKAERYVGPQGPSRRRLREELTPWPAARQDADEAITGINVTPLVDITLVLLIIFMVTTKIVIEPVRAARSAQGGRRARATCRSSSASSWRPTAAPLVDGKPHPERRRHPGSSRATRRPAHPDLRAVIKADAAVPHGRVIHVLDLLKQAHVEQDRVRGDPGRCRGSRAPREMMQDPSTARTEEVHATAPRRSRPREPSRTTTR